MWLIKCQRNNKRDRTVILKVYLEQTETVELDENEEFGRQNWGVISEKCRLMSRMK